MRPKRVQPIGVYRLYDAKDNLLYVGSGSVFLRIAEHMAAWHWSSEISHMTIDLYHSRLDAYLAEQEIIEKELPKYNRRGKEGRTVDLYL